jgi:murein DD-endopeptidase MepM/ murein hydrolase activator NlpD
MKKHIALFTGVTILNIFNINTPSVFATETDAPSLIQSKDKGEFYQLENKYDSLIEQLEGLETSIKQNKAEYKKMEKSISKLQDKINKTQRETKELQSFVHSQKKRFEYIEQHSIFRRYLSYLFQSSDEKFYKRIKQGIQQIKSDRQFFKEYKIAQEKISKNKNFLSQAKYSLESSKVELQGINELLKDQYETQKNLSSEHNQLKQQIESQSLTNKESKAKKKKDLSIGDYDFARDKASDIPIHKGAFTFPTIGTISSCYGYRNGKWEYGITIQNKSKDAIPVVAAADGIVTKSLFSNKWGNVIYILHKIDKVEFETMYAHLNTRVVQAGDKVSKGDYLGTMGKTGDIGSSKSKILYFDIKKINGNTIENVNPLLYIPLQN